MEYSGGAHACGQAGIRTMLVERDPRDIAADIIIEDEPEPESSLYEAGAVIGQYRLLGILGEGAIGRVYLAEHLALGRRVALKMVRSELAKKRSVVERFFGEARAVNQIRHENIVEITDFVRDDERDRSYYIMELLEGVTVRELLDASKTISVERTIAIVSQIVSALEAVHEKGIVHRDLKLENVFLIRRNDADFVKLLDFGAAKLTNLNDDRLTVKTQSGALVGTPQYMAPEQTLGAEVDHRADIYAIGVVLYEMLTGRAPFAGNTGEVLLAHRNDTAARPKSLVPRIPEKLDALIMRCLEKKAADRPQNMAEVGAALALLRPRPRRMAPAIGAAIALVVSAVVATLLWQQRVDAPIAISAELTPPPPPVSIPVPVPVSVPPPALTPAPAPVLVPVRTESIKKPKKKTRRQPPPDRPPPPPKKKSKTEIGLGDMRDPFGE